MKLFLRGFEIAIGVLALATGVSAVIVESFGDTGLVSAWSPVEIEDPALPLRIFFGVLVFWLCTRIDSVIGYLNRSGTKLENATDRRCTAVALLLLVSAGFLLRIADLGIPALNWDEAMYAWVGASSTLSDLWHSVTTRSPHPPAYFALLHEILEWSWEPYWLRLPSVLAGSALILASFVFVRRLAGPPAGLVMAVLVTFAPMLIQLSKVARNYTIAFLLGVCAATFFVRYLQRERPRDAIAFALTSVVGVLVHYSFLIVLLAQYLQLGLTGLVRRHGPGWWARVAACQIPVLVVIAGLLRFHIRQLDPAVEATHEWMYAAYMGFFSRDWLAPIAGIWRYLSPLDLTIPCLVVYFAGLAMLVARRLNEVFLVCVLPVGVAYAMSTMGRYPLHESRHSAYLFPFLFAPVALLAAEIATAGRSLRLRRGELGGEAGALSTNPVPVGSALWVHRLAVVVVAFCLGCFVDASMADYRVMFTPAAASAERVTEFLRYYRRDDVDRAFEIVESRAKPHDIVLLTADGLYQLRYHYRLRPVREENAGDETKASLRLGPIPGVDAYIDQAGVRYYFSPHASLLFRWLSTNTILEAAEEIRDTFGLKDIGDLWVIRGGWDASVSEAFRADIPTLRFDAEVTEQTNDVLFHLDAWNFAITLAYRRQVLGASAERVPNAVPAIAR